ncbi:MAG: LytR C-terminal domain-containing protein [Deltaproteobacteria bacterium]|nr:LytR C-terminal domain-containing protein [Deltaproteobacteria bacterium]
MGNYPSQIRPAASETSRLLSNAHYYKLMGRPDAALKEMEEAHLADPDNVKIADALAQNYQELGQFQRAQEIYQGVLARHGSNRALQNNLCFSFYLQGNLTKAESCFKEALERDPGNQAARNNLGLVWCRQGKLAEAQKLWEEAEGVAGAQARLNQALAFLGMKAPANYAKMPEAMSPSPQAAASSKPAPPAIAASLAKPELAAAVVAVKTPALAGSPAPAPMADQKVAAKPAEAKPTPQLPAAAPPKPAPVAVAPQVKHELAAAPTPGKVPASVPPSTTTSKMDQKLAAQTAEVKPAMQSAAAAPPRAAAVAVAPPAKPEVAAAPAPAKAAHPVPALAPMADQKVAAKSAEPKLTPQPLAAAPLKFATPTPVRLPVRPVKMAAAATVNPPTPASSAAVKQWVDQKVMTKTTRPPQPAAPKVLAATARALKAKSPTTGKVSPPAPAVKPSGMALTEADCQAPSPPLTALERVTTNIEVLNGIGARNIARQSRALLYQEAFNVTEIGNHIDFGAENTVIYYRPGTERVVQGLKWQVFPKARIEATSKLKDGIAIKILLGRDLLDQPLTMARIAAAASGESLPSVNLTRTTRTQPNLAASAAHKVAAEMAATAASKGDLTTGDLLNTPIEICNGTRARHLASRAKSLLSSEGYTVGLIGNYHGFKSKRTVIYYRPAAEKVARTLNSEIFPEARLTPHINLKQGTAIKVVLGSDFLERPQQFSKLAQNGHEAP